MTRCSYGYYDNKLQEVDYYYVGVNQAIDAAAAVVYAGAANDSGSDADGEDRNSVTVVMAGACAAPDRSSGQAASAEESSPDAAGGSAKPRTGQPWWKLSQYSREEEFKSWVYGDVRPGRGLLSGDEDGYILYRCGSGNSADPTKPTKVRHLPVYRHSPNQENIDEFTTWNSRNRSAGCLRSRCMRRGRREHGDGPDAACNAGSGNCRARGD